MARKIEYEEKAPFQDDPDIPEKNKVMSENMNEIKDVVNENAEDLNDVSNKVKDISNIIDLQRNPVLNWKGSVDTYSDLLALENVEEGDLYTIIDQKKNYGWNGEEWIFYSEVANEEISYKYYLKIEDNKEANAEITIPCYYKVGEEVLDVYLNGERLLKSTDDAGTDGHYREVGDTGSISNKIKTTTDWNLEKGDVLDLVVRGEYNAT